MLRAAKYLGVAPWTLQNKSAMWMYQAIRAENAESWADNEREKMRPSNGQSRRWF